MNPLQAYFEQFSGEDYPPVITIENDEDLRRFQDLMRDKWRAEHADVLREWQKLKDQHDTTGTN